MITKYHHNNIDYNTFDEIRHLFPNVSFPETITPEVLAPLGITIIQEADSVYVPTTEDIVNGYIADVQFYLDLTVQERGYDGIMSLATYKGSKVAKFAKEGAAGADWRDDVWSKCYEILDAIKAGTRTDIPTAEQLILELPVFTWGD